MALLVPLHPARQPHLGLQPLLLAHLVLLVMLVLLANPTSLSAVADCCSHDRRQQRRLQYSGSRY